MTTPTTDPVTNPSPADIVAANAPSEIKLGRVGHYSYLGICQEARIVHVVHPELVNLVATDSDGDSRPHLGVPVVDLRISPTDTGTFHLNRSCPWGR